MDETNSDRNEESLTMTSHNPIVDQISNLITENKENLLIEIEKLENCERDSDSLIGSSNNSQSSSQIEDQATNVALPIIKDENKENKDDEVMEIEESTVYVKKEENVSEENSTETDNVKDEEDEDIYPIPVPTELETYVQRPKRDKTVTFKNISNGTLPKSGKPMMSTISRRSNKARGRPKRKVLPVYQSQISENKIGIKLCIKKSLDLSQPKSKTNRKRSRKSRSKQISDSEDSEYEKRRRRSETVRTRSNNNTDKNKNIKDEPIEQSGWGDQIPLELLENIFQRVVSDDGTLPSVIRLGRVCKLWNHVSLFSSLWKNIDLNVWTKERHRTEIRLKCLIENRLRDCNDLNLSNFKITNIQCVLERLLDRCPNLTGLSLAGWKGLHAEHLTFLVQEFKSLQRIDLSSINTEMTTKSAVGLSSLCNSMQTMMDNLTHLNLAHNRLAGIPQLVTTLSTHCPNLMSLDLSNVSTIATSHGVLHVEKLQHGCPKLKGLLITNSHIILSNATLQEQMDSPGFPNLEELSVASLADESRLLNDEHLQRILKTSTKLKLLDIRGCARLSHDSLIRLPAWDLKHLFLSQSSITRDVGSGLELIASKWAHSLTEIDFAWANVQDPLDNALRAFAEKGLESPLSHLNLCGSSVSLEAVKEVLKKCPSISSINLASCRGLPRGVKRLLQGSAQITELKETLGVIEKSKTLPELTTLKTDLSFPSSAIPSSLLSPLSLQSPSPQRNEMDFMQNELKLEMT